MKDLRDFLFCDVIHVDAGDGANGLFEFSAKRVGRIAGYGILLVSKSGNDGSGRSIFRMAEVGHSHCAKMALPVEQAHDKIGSDPLRGKTDFRAPPACI